MIKISVYNVLFNHAKWFTKANTVQELNIHTLLITFLQSPYTLRNIYKVSTAATFVITWKFTSKVVILYHTGVKTLVYNLYFLEAHIEIKPYKYYYNDEGVTLISMLLYHSSEKSLGYSLYHKDTHMDEKPYQCRYCDKLSDHNIQVIYHTGDTNLVNRLNYYKPHTGVNTYNSSLCDKSSTIKTPEIFKMGKIT